jgi:predicted TIM-barrel fold metal-dependent hydrolase
LGRFDVVVIDVDSHWEPIREDEDPSARMALFSEVLIGDIYGQVPRGEWPSIQQLLPPSLVELFASPSAELTRTRLGAADIAGRLAWCDQIGIDYQFVNGGGLTGLEFKIEDPVARRNALGVANERLLDALEGHTDRFSPVVTLDLTDLDLAIADLERSRGRGSRAFHLRAEPPGGVSYTHPHFDRLWSATVDLGMIAYLHIGNAPSYFDAGWANLGLDAKGDAGRAEVTRLSNVARMQSGETMLAALAYGGVFERHPNLTVLVAELWAGWIPFLLYRLNQHTHPDRKPNPVLGDWPYKMGAGDMLRRNLRATVLPTPDHDAETMLREPGMLVFSSDYPHLEGSTTPIEDLRPVLERLDPVTRTQFMGGNILEVFERMGDPLPVASRTPA